jgi:ubiquinone/menaquinone biosynthesis C-methylase UbiE
MTWPTPTRIVVQLDAGRSPIAGSLTDPACRVRTFTGWVEFAHAVSAALATASTSALRPPLETTMTITDAAPSTRYLLDAGWYAERDRLNSLTRLYDPTTVDLCRHLGLGSGWRCLEVGAGTGSVAEQFAAEVGSTGGVLAVDLDIRFLQPLAGATLQVEQLDVVRDRLPAGQFDLVHARLLLEHLAAREQVLASLVNAVAPGGWLVVEDLDWATSTVVDPPSDAHRIVADACMALFAGHAYDPYYGRRLPRSLEQHGLLDVGTHAESKQVRGHVRDGVPQWELLADQLAPALLARSMVTQANLDAFHALWHDDQTLCFAPLMVSSWGRRPPLLSQSDA